MMRTGEKRRHPRASAKIALTYRLLQNGPQKSRHVQSLDLSRGGMSFRNPEFIPHHAKAHVEFFLPDRHQPVRVLSEVVYTKEHYAGNHFTVGIKFQRPLQEGLVSSAAPAADYGAPCARNPPRPWQG